jgi:hypothetical protein
VKVELFGESDAEAIRLPGGEKSGLLSAVEFKGCSREQIKAMVRAREIRILVGTDAASEGLNLQRLGEWCASQPERLGELAKPRIADHPHLASDRLQLLAGNFQNRLRLSSQTRGR